jgi:AsmA protein
MKTLIRTLAWLAGVVVLLLVAVAVAVTFYFDPNDYKADIESVIESSTGRQVRIPGDLSLGLLPCCAVKVGRVELDNPAGFAEQQFVAIDSASVSIGLFRLLLRQEIVIGEVVLEGFDATLITRRDGTVNWEFEGESADAAPAVDTSADTEGSAVTLNQLSVEGLRFTGGRVRWLDETTGDDILVNQLSVVTGPIELGEPFDLEAGFSVAGLAEGLDGEFLYTGRPVVDQENLTADLSDSVIELILTGNDLPGGKATIAITAPELTVGGSVNAVVANQLKLDISTGPLVLRAVASGVVADSRPSFSGTLEADSFAPRELLDLLDIEIVTADPDVLSLMDLRADWAFRGDRVGLSSLVMRIDDSQLSGELGLGSIEKEQILFDLSIDAINLDRYLEPTAEESAGGDAAAAGGTAAAEEELFPVDTLRELNAQGRFRIGEMVVSGLVMSDFTMNLTADGGLLRLNPLTATMYQGSYSGDIRLDVRGTQPKLSLNENLSNLQIGGLLLDAQDLQNVEGLFTTGITATSTGNTEAAVIAGLNGNLAFNLTDGLYRGRDFWYEVRRQKALIKGEPVPAAPADPTTDITRLQGSGVLTNGVLQNNDFTMQLPFVRLNGTGSADLNSMLLNYKLSAKVVGRPQFDDGTNLDELQGLTLPVTIKGPVDEPDIVIDLTSLITGLATKKLQDTLLKKYGGEEPAADGEGTAEQEPISDRDATKQLLRKGVRDLLN